MVRFTILFSWTLCVSCSADQANDNTLSPDVDMQARPSVMGDMGPIIGAPSQQDFGPMDSVVTSPNPDASTPNQTMVEDMAPSIEDNAACQDVCVPNDVTWGKTGGRTPYSAVYSLSPCQSQVVYLETPFANNPDDHRCERTLDPCTDSDGELIESLAMYLATPAVREALRGNVFFGIDGRVFDGQVLSIRVDDNEISIGDPCDGRAENCVTPPVDILEMADLLWDAGRRMEATEPACATIADDL